MTVGHGGSGVTLLPSHPIAVIGDVVAGVAVAASWTDYVHEWLSIVVTAMAGVYYLFQFYQYLKHRRDKK